jgi:hypothetical protein
MRRIAVHALVLLACAVAMNCGDSDPTSPDAPPPAGGGGGGSGGGGSRGTAIYTDGVFDDNAWDDYVEAFGAGGTGGTGHLRFNGQEGADYRQITITVNSAEGSGSTAQVAVFSFKRSTRYSAPNDGEIFSVDYSEDSILQAGGGNGQYSAPAFRQNGKNYTLVPGAGAFPTPEATWTPHSVRGLRQNEFRTLANASDHPDFSATGAPIEMGFMRMHSVPAGNRGETKRGGIDNWRLTLFR